MIKVYVIPHIFRTVWKNKTGRVTPCLRMIHNISMWHIYLLFLVKNIHCTVWFTPRIALLSQSWGGRQSPTPALKLSAKPWSRDFCLNPIIHCCKNNFPKHFSITAVALSEFQWGASVAMCGSLSSVNLSAVTGLWQEGFPTNSVVSEGRKRAPPSVISVPFVRSGLTSGDDVVSPGSLVSTGQVCAVTKQAGCVLHSG